MISIWDKRYTIYRHTAQIPFVPFTLSHKSSYFVEHENALCRVMWVLRITSTHCRNHNSYLHNVEPVKLLPVNHQLLQSIQSNNFMESFSGMFALSACEVCTVGQCAGSLIFRILCQINYILLQYFSLQSISQSIMKSKHENDAWVYHWLLIF